MRKTSNDYRKELTTARNTLISIEEHIKDKLNKMVESFPNAIIMVHQEVPVKAKSLSKEWVNKLTPEEILDHITTIEEHNAKMEKVVQVSMY